MARKPPPFMKKGKKDEKESPREAAREARMPGGGEMNEPFAKGGKVKGKRK